ncbi:type III-A CRISPR-associated RAMP protein Csm5 [Methanothermococcus sp.]|uniref:type III-A CRISPR-associated RAMP protein Csm5 n=1 Tax=Methanothermococcus sp. TaxID=2614238 RepID=UPI0025CFB25B|nr:type III-A CRISPR-associated RAMP protein Csm5 [Methanothermococcus sp.]
MNIFRPNESKPKMEATKKILNITTLSPLNIGNGDVYSNLDYYIENSKAKIINIDKLLESIDDINKINELVQVIKSNMGNNRVEKDTKEIYESIGLYPEEHILKEIDCKIRKDARIQVKKFINQKGNYYIPGSSLKGAIRTAYIFDYYDKNIDELIKILKNNDIKPYLKGNEVIKTAIGGINKDFFKYLLITDSNIIPPENFEFINTIRYNTMDARKGKKSETIPEPKESLKKNSEFKMELTIKNSFPKNFEDIKNMCNRFSRTIIKFEMKNEYLPQGLKDFYKNKILNDLNGNNSFYLTLGSGSGFLSKTVYLLLWKHNKNLNLIKKMLPLKKGKDKRTGKFLVQPVNDYIEFPRTRVIDSKKEIPMGWIKITAK